VDWCPAALRLQGRIEPGAGSSEGATQSANDLRQIEISQLDGWTERTSIFEQWHEDFLQATQTVNQLEAALADIQSEMTVRLEAFDSIEGICRFKRQSIPKLDEASFKERFPDESAECVKGGCSASLRKSIYPARSYLARPPRFTSTSAANRVIPTGFTPLQATFRDPSHRL